MRKAPGAMRGNKKTHCSPRITFMLSIFLWKEVKNSVLALNDKNLRGRYLRLYASRYSMTQKHGSFRKSQIVKLGLFRMDSLAPP